MMAELLLVEAVNDALHTEMARDDDVMVMGEDVGRAGGVFRATAGLRDRFGTDRCVDTPLAEAGILGTAVGLCMAGWKPVTEMQYDAFSYPCLDQLITHVGRYERYLQRLGVLSEQQAQSVRDEAAELMRAGIAAAEAEPDADVSLVFENTYESPPASFAADLAELRRLSGSLEQDARGEDISF